MNEMVERIARIFGERALNDGSPCCLYSDDVCRKLARAAIEAMREPTKAMAERGDDAAGTLAITHDASGVYVWQVMIDAALKGDDNVSS